MATDSCALVSLPGRSGPKPPLVPQRCAAAAPSCLGTVAGVARPKGDAVIRHPGRMPGPGVPGSSLPPLRLLQPQGLSWPVWLPAGRSRAGRFPPTPHDRRAGKTTWTSCWNISMRHQSRRDGRRDRRRAGGGRCGGRASQCRCGSPDSRHGTWVRRRGCVGTSVRWAISTTHRADRLSWRVAPRHCVR